MKECIICNQNKSINDIKLEIIYTKNGEFYISCCKKCNLTNSSIYPCFNCKIKLYIYDINKENYDPNLFGYPNGNIKYNKLCCDSCINITKI